MIAIAAAFRHWISRRSVCIAAAATLATSATGPAQAQTPAAFYAGRTLTLLVSHPAGGGYDTYARFFARHLSRLLAGNPTVVVQNMPGAAGIVMTNHLYAQAPHDGSVIGLGAGPLATAALLGLKGARYDARRLSWIGSMNTEIAVALAWHTQPVKTAKDLAATELVVAAGGTTDISAVAPLSLARLLGLKLKVVTGYGGSADQVLAVERGEVGGIGGYNFGSLKSVRPAWIRDKLVNILLQYAFEPHPELASVPTLTQLARTSVEQEILSVIFLPQQMGRPIFAPPGIPADRLAALRAAFDAFVADKQVSADGAKAQIEMLKPIPGAAIEALVDRLHKVTPDIVHRAAETILPADLLQPAAPTR